MITGMKTILFILACVITLHAEKVVNAQIDNDDASHVEFVFPNDWNVDLDDRHAEAISIYDNISPVKMFCKVVAKPSLTEMNSQSWSIDKEKQISSMMRQVERMISKQCQSIQFEQKVVYPGIPPVIDEKAFHYSCKNDEQIFSISLNFFETEQYFIMFGLFLFDSPAQNDIYARVQSLANCINIVPNRVLIH